MDPEQLNDFYQIRMHWYLFQQPTVEDYVNETYRRGLDRDRQEEGWTWL